MHLYELCSSVLVCLSYDVCGRDYFCVFVCCVCACVCNQFLHLTLLVVSSWVMLRFIALCCVTLSRCVVFSFAASPVTKIWLPPPSCRSCGTAWLQAQSAAPPRISRYTNWSFLTQHPHPHLHQYQRARPYPQRYVNYRLPVHCYGHLLLVPAAAKEAAVVAVIGNPSTTASPSACTPLSQSCWSHPGWLAREPKPGSSRWVRGCASSSRTHTVPVQ